MKQVINGALQVREEERPRPTGRLWNDVANHEGRRRTTRAGTGRSAESEIGEAMAVQRMGNLASD